ncbi:hypothetical protein ISU07_07465 [Nocardioides islandensis]|uniref:Uncharacterized protein n=1 Tax=Nocardioides islandensis TaxID=433663 RepID=A0A930VAM6_9ACTN|nr:hypothetical protein [Nocardioides islandensis]MBF4762963.1 hypothetical protein [Nocardioides islandensis]
MTSWLRWTALPVLAVALVAGVLAVQVGHGGGSFEPLHPADPCVEREVTSRAEGIDALTERLVLLGIDGAACRLHINREALTLELAQSDDPTDAQVDALRGGLHDAVHRMKADGTLPPISSFVDEALDNADLNGFLKAAIRALPDSVIDAALKTDDVLDRTIDDLDLRELLANVDDQDDLNRQVEAAVTQAVKDSLVDRLRNLL